MPSDFLKPGRDGLAFMCSGSLFQDLIVLGKNENLWLSTVATSVHSFVVQNHIPFLCYFEIELKIKL